VQCAQLIGDGAAVDLLDLRDGLWEGWVSISQFHLSSYVRFHYVTAFRPQIQVLLPVDGYVYGPSVKPVIVTHISDVSEPSEPLLGIYLHIEINNQVFGLVRNPGRDKYIPLKDASGNLIEDGTYTVELQVLDLLERPCGDPVSITLVIRRAHQHEPNLADGAALPALPGGFSWLDGVVRNASMEEDVLRNTSMEQDVAAPPEGGQCRRCSAHGRCMGRGCECEADWVGARCEHHVLFHTHRIVEMLISFCAPRCEHHVLFHTHFLPLPWRAAGDVERAGVAAALSGELELLQNPPDCAKPSRFLTDSKQHPLALGHGLRSAAHAHCPARPTQHRKRQAVTPPWQVGGADAGGGAGQGHGVPPGQHVAALPLRQVRQGLDAHSAVPSLAVTLAVRATLYTRCTARLW
jgi:hypothetical protein